MDVHRGRFVPYPSSAINALALSHSSGEELFEHREEYLKLAVGRANGDIEIWNPAKGAWVQESIFRGGRNRSVEGLTWIQELPEVDAKGRKHPGVLRLFSIGYSSTVTEWDISTGLPVRNSTGNHSEVWCLASQPRRSTTSAQTNATDAEREVQWGRQNLAIGCADGTVAILSTEDSDLQFQKFLIRPTSKRARTLSITWKDRNTVVAGFANSSIGIYDVRRSSCIRTITLGAGAAGGPKDILVWAVRCLPNGDVISGDSAGEVRFFEGKQYSQYQRIAGHEADILDLATSGDGMTIWSAGMDRKTAVYAKASKGPSKRGAWSRSQVKTFHEHDIKAMAAYEGGSKKNKLSFIASGGIDTNLVIIPMRGFWTEYHRAISGLPQYPPLVSAPRARTILSWWERELSVWKVGMHDNEAHPYKLLKRIALKGDENITSASITAESGLIATATATGVKLFSLRIVDDLHGHIISDVKQVNSSVLNFGAKQVQFSPDGNWLALVTHTNEVKMARPLYQRDRKPFVRVFPKLISLPFQTMKKIRDTYLTTINRLTFSPNSQTLVTSDLAGRIHTWCLQGIEDPTADDLAISDSPSSSESESDSDSDSDTSSIDRSNQITKIRDQHWALNPSSSKLPRLPSAPILLTFRPSNPTHLIVLTAQHQLYEFDLSTGALTEWSKRNPSWKLPEKFTTLVDRAMGCVWDSHGRKERLWLYGSSWTFMLDLAKDFAETKEHIEKYKGKKRKRAQQSGAGDEVNWEWSGLKVEAKALDGVNGVKEEEDEEEDMELDGELDATEAQGEDNDPAQKLKERAWWCTFKYRPILGMVSLDDPEARKRKKKNDGVEVVLIERPIWDLDLPERFATSYER